MKRTKYNTAAKKADKPQADGYTFDSKAEYRRYLMLKEMLAADEIVDLVVHPLLPLVVNGKLVGRFTPDFTYFALDGGWVIEDVKSPPTRKAEAYRLRKRLVKAIYGVEITEWMEPKKARKEVRHAD